MKDNLLIILGLLALAAMWVYDHRGGVIAKADEYMDRLGYTKPYEGDCVCECPSPGGAEKEPLVDPEEGRYTIPDYFEEN